MTQETPHDDDISSREDFKRALGGLLATALDNGIDPRGAWEYRSNGTATDWEVMVIELEAADD